MKSFSTLLAITSCLFLFSFRANAQWTLFSDLLSQMDNGTNESFFNNLNSLDGNWNPDLDLTDDLFGQLNGNLFDSIPPGDLDSSYLNGLNAGLDSLLGHLPGFGFSGADQDTLIGELDWINGILNNNFDSLGGAFGLYQDSLSFDSMNWDVTILGFDDLNNQSFQFLLDSANIVGDLSNPNGPGNFSDIIGQLFDSRNFPDIEIAFGTQSTDLKYYLDESSATAKVARIGSVPRFDRKVFDGNGKLPVFPLEPRWHVEVSWTGESNAPTPTTNESITITDNSNDKEFNPLLLNGDFAIMATPSIGTLGNTSFRLLTSLGMEFGTFAPAHKDYARPYTEINKGFMTGVGAQAGAGFAFSNGALTVYTLGTFAQGQAVNSPKPYPYTSRRYEVGMRYGNIVNVRYSSSFASWQPDENRYANVKNQFTVGIILAELRH